MLRQTQKNVLMNKNSLKRRRNDVRQGTTDRGSANIANLVVNKLQFRQRVVLAANRTQTQHDDAISNPKNRVAAKTRLDE
jgi:hypothetical protein